MAVEPEPTSWALPDPSGADDDLVGVGADLAPGTLVSAYRKGLFPMPIGRRTLGWWSPDPRGILPLDGLRVSKSLRRSCHKFSVTVDRAFPRVVEACADPRRPNGWITREIAAAYCRLHELGWAHSVEVWDDAGDLAGGLYGVAIGGLFAGESMFHHRPDASKVALVGLVTILSREGEIHGDADDRLLDVQWRTPHLATLGVVEVSRDTYLDRLTRAVRLPAPDTLSR
ncbi:MAG: leucyl/phenylalanyl-tRNA--protein transferase [Acidimicrobiia bacterium]|nr:leucyl/phenylalanyl-tRNA--protein transferase [Acidimicrobiia bacterium]